MKALLSLVLSFTLVAGSLPAWAGDHDGSETPAGTSAKNFNKVVNNVIYSLDNLSDVIKALKIQDNATGAAISKTVASEVMARVGAAIELLEAIVVDPDMSQDKKKEYIDDLETSIGEIFFRVIRHHGEDKVDPTKEIKDLATADTFIGKIMQGLMTSLKEFGLDLKATVTFPQDANGKRIWGQIERRNREKLGQDFSLKLMEYAHNSLSQLDSGSKIRQYEVKNWKDDVLEPAITLRRARLGAQRLTAFTYFGMAFLALQTGWPVPFDFIGLITHHSEHSYEYSGYMETLAFLGLATVKSLTISGKTVDILEATAKAFENPEEPIPDLNLKESLGTKTNRLASNSTSQVVDRCKLKFATNRAKKE